MGKNRARLSKVGSRLTGISLPLGVGVSWEPPTSDASTAEGLIRFLEDRRVLYASADVENSEHCVASVLQIREQLTNTLSAGGFDKPLEDSLRAMRASCRTFLQRIRLDPQASQFEIVSRYHEGRFTSTGLQDWVLNQAIGELRGVFGIHIALLVSRYGLDVEADLAQILPADPDG